MLYIIKSYGKLNQNFGGMCANCFLFKNSNIFDFNVYYLNDYCDFALKFLANSRRGSIL